jgi:hypothetical protein
VRLFDKSIHRRQLSEATREGARRVSLDLVCSARSRSRKWTGALGGELIYQTRKARLQLSLSARNDFEAERRAAAEGAGKAAGTFIVARRATFALILKPR